MDINGLCQHCNEKLLFPDNMTGDVVACPHCGQQTQLVAHNPNLKKCPDCQQPVSVHAAACPHCGRPLSSPTPALPPPASQPSPMPVATAASAPMNRPRPEVQNHGGVANIIGNTVTIGGTVYQLGQINSFRIKDGECGCLALGFFLLSAMVALGSFLGPGANPSSYALGFFFGMLALGMLAFIVQSVATKTLLLTTSSGEIAALKSTNRAILERAATEIVAAISSR